MYLSRRFAPAAAVISLFIALSILAVISFGEGFRTVLFREGWLKSTAIKWKREDAGSLFMSYPWKWQSSAENTKDDAKDASNDVVTITVCTPADTLPTTVTSPLSTVPVVPQNSSGLLNGGLSNTGSGNTASLLGASACSNSPSTLPACGLLPTSAGYVCQYYPPTAYPTDCSECVKTSTVTNTYLSTVSNCNTTQFSLIAAFTVTVTANLSISAAARATNISLAIIPAKSTLASQGFLLLPTGNLSSSAIICPNGTLAKRQQGCITSVATSTPTLSSAASTNSTTFGLVSNSAGSGSASQTLSRDPSNSTNLANVTTSSVSSITASVLSNLTTGAGFATEPSTLNFKIGILTTTNSVSGTVAPSITSIQGLPSILTGNTNNASNVSLSSVLPVGSSVLPTIPSSTNLATVSLPSVGPSLQGSVSGAASSVSSVASSGLPTVTSVPNAVFGAPSHASSIISSGLPVLTSIPSIISGASNSVNSITSSGLSVTSTPKGFVPSIVSVATGIISSALPVVTSIQGIVSSALDNVTSVAASVLPAILPVQSIVSSVLSDITGITGSVLPVVTAIPSAGSSVASNVNSIIASVLAPATANESLIPSIISEVTSAVGPVVTSVPNVISAALSNVNSVAKSALTPIAPVESLIPSIVSDVTGIVRSALTSVIPLISAVLSNSIAPSVSPVVTPVQGLTSSILSDATAIVLPVVTPIPSVVNSVLNNLIPAAASVLTPVLSVPAVENGAGNIVSSISKPITSAAIPAVVFVANSIPNLFQSLGGNLLKEVTNPALTGMSTAISVTSPVMSDSPGIVTVTQVVGIVTVFVPIPPPTTST